MTKLSYVVAVALVVVGVVVLFATESWALIVVAALLMLAGVVVASLAARAGRSGRAAAPR